MAVLKAENPKSHLDVISVSLPIWINARAMAALEQKKRVADDATLRREFFYCNVPQITL